MFNNHGNAVPREQNAFSRIIDFCLRRVLGVFDFCEDESCLLRLQITQAPHQLDFPLFSVQPGEPVLEIHLWNERIPPLPPEGPDLAWVARSHRMFVQSLYAAAREIQNVPGMTASGRLAG